MDFGQRGPGVSVWQESQGQMLSVLWTLWNPKRIQSGVIQLDSLTEYQNIKQKCFSNRVFLQIIQ